MEQLHRYIDQAAKMLELGGVAIIRRSRARDELFLRDGWKCVEWRSVYERYRANLGRGILLELELLVCADIIETITAHRRSPLSGCWPQ